jgi:transcription antitermination factor NusG
MSKESYWTVAQTVSRMEHLVRRDIEKTNHGAFLPTYARLWSDKHGLPCAREYPLFRGYVFFLTQTDERGDYDWSGINDIHGVYKVLSDANGIAKRVDASEMLRMMIGHATGDHDEIVVPPISRRKRRRRPRPRRSKAYRASTVP